MSDDFSWCWRCQGSGYYIVRGIRGIHHLRCTVCPASIGKTLQELMASTDAG